jgi:hypothetical protein
MFALSRFSFAMTTSEVRHTEIKHAFITHDACTLRALPDINHNDTATH